MTNAPKIEPFEANLARETITRANFDRRTKTGPRWGDALRAAELVAAHETIDLWDRQQKAGNR